MYKIFMLIALPVLAIAWVAYMHCERKMRIEEKKQPKQVSQHLQKTRSEVSDWAQKIGNFKKPTHKPDQSVDNKD